jgi:hypothetical protein
MFSCIIAKHREFGLQLGWDIQPRHQPIENIRSRQLVSYPFILLSMIVQYNRQASYLVDFDAALYTTRILE